MVKTINIRDLALVIRSKNAGAFHITFDIIFKNKEIYDKVKKTEVINEDLIAKLYKVSANKKIDIFCYDPGNAIKISMRRRLTCGAFGDTDVYGAQQHAPLYKIQIPWN